MAFFTGDAASHQQQQHAADAARRKLQAMPGRDRLAYLRHLESRCPLSKIAAPGSRPPNVQPSLLQTKLCAGSSNRLSSTLPLTATADGLSFLQLDAPDGSSTASDGTAAAAACAWQFALQLLQATHVGPTGLGPAEQPLRSVARLAIFDRQQNRFLGNVHSVPAAAVRPHKGLGSLGSCWSWDGCGPQAAAGTGPGGSVADVSCQQEPRLEQPVAPGQLAGSAQDGAAGSSSCALGAGAAAAAATAAAAAAGHALASAVSGPGGANACIVRCAGVARDPVTGLRQLDGERLSVLVELNIAVRLVAEDVGALPQDEARGAGMVDEQTMAWAMVSLKRCAELTREMTISVPLYTGSLYAPVPLATVWAEKRTQHPMHSLLSAPPCPQLHLRVGPLPTRPPPMLPYWLMPCTLIARRDVACLMAAARLALVQHVAAADNEGSDTGSAAAALAAAAACGGHGDPVLAALPGLLDNPVLLRELLAKWDARVRGIKAAAEAEVAAQEGCLVVSAGGCACASSAGPAPPTQAQLLAALRISALEVAPLLHCSSLPPATIANFAEHQAHRAAVAARFCRRPLLEPGEGGGCGAASAQWWGRGCEGCHPVEVLSRSHAEFGVHRPFDVAETRVAVAATQQPWCAC